MTKVDVALPEDARSYVEEQVASGRYENVGAYLLELVERDRRRALRSEIESQLVSALQSPSEPFTDADWDQIERQGQQILARRKAP